MLAKSGILGLPGSSRTIERLQVRALNLTFLQLEYHDALNEAGLETLEQRRETKCRQFFKNITHHNHKLNLLAEKETNHNSETVDLMSHLKSELSAIKSIP